MSVIGGVDVVDGGGADDGGSVDDGMTASGDDSDGDGDGKGESIPGSVSQPPLHTAMVLSTL